MQLNQPLDQPSALELDKSGVQEHVNGHDGMADSSSTRKCTDSISPLKEASSKQEITEQLPKNVHNSEINYNSALKQIEDRKTQANSLTYEQEFSKISHNRVKSNLGVQRAEDNSNNGKKCILSTINSKNHSNNTQTRGLSLPSDRRATQQHTECPEASKQTQISRRNYEIRQAAQEKPVRNEAGAGLNKSEQKEQKATYSINTESGAILNSHSLLSERSRPLSLTHSKQALLVKMTNRMASELERKAKRFAEPLKLHVSEFNTSPRDILDESKISNRGSSLQNKPSQNLRTLDVYAALKSDVKAWRTYHEKHSNLINNGLRTLKNDRPNTNKSFSYPQSEAVTPKSKLPDVRNESIAKTASSKKPNSKMSLNLTMDVHSDVKKETTDHTQNLPSFRRLTSRARSSSRQQQPQETTIDSSFGKGGTSFGRSERQSVFDIKNLTPGPAYDLASHKGIASGRTAPKINLVSYDRSEFLAPNTFSPSPQRYYQNREFERDAFKSSGSPVFGYERNSTKKQAWDEHLKKVAEKKRKESPRVPYYDPLLDTQQNKPGSFPKDHHRELFKIDKDIPGPGNYNTKVANQTPAQISFGRAKRKTDAVKYFSLLLKCLI